MMERLLRCLAITLVLVPFDAAAQTAPDSSQPATTLHSYSNLVVVDVVATDDKHSSVHQLAAADFTVLEDGKPQTVKVFEEHAALPPTAPRTMPKLKLSPGSFTNYSPVPPSGTLNILLFDKLNTPLDDQMYVRDQVLKYLKEAHPGTRTAIFSLTTELKMLQGFTSDPELLRALVLGRKGNPSGSPLMNNAMEGDQPGADDPLTDAISDMPGMRGNSPDSSTILANLQQFETEQQAFQIQLRQRYTLDALNQLARYLGRLPGRKNLIWFSGSFPINILPDGDISNPFAVVGSAGGEFRETVDLLGRSQVAVYPIDARGLMTPPMMRSSQSGTSLARNPGAFSSANSKWFQERSSEQSTLMQMAEETGGEGFVNTNGLKEAVEKSIEVGSNYYTIAYTTANRNWNGAFRRIQVKVDRPKVTLAYRRGYYADDPDNPAHRGQGQDGQSVAPPYNAMHAAMLHGAPGPSELIFVADVRPSTADTEVAPMQGNQPAKQLSGPYRRYTVTFALSPYQVSCAAGPDGVHHCGMDFLTFVYDADGVLVNMQTNGINAAVSEQRFAEFMKRDFVYRQEVSVPAKGEYYLRIGMHDRNTDNMGAVEVPAAAVAKLPPPASAGSPRK
ncbi:MAG: VWA domain-containing protein [Terracidiphilus sp.]